MPKTIEDVANEIASDIDAWIERMLMLRDGVPDFWDELNTSERLGEWLAVHGYRKKDS